MFAILRIQMIVWYKILSSLPKIESQISTESNLQSFEHHSTMVLNLGQANNYLGQLKT